MPEPEADPGETDALLALVRARYGGRLDGDQWREVEQAVRALAAAVRALRAVPLANADEPYPPFAPYRDAP